MRSTSEYRTQHFGQDALFIRGTRRMSLAAMLRVANKTVSSATYSTMGSSKSYFHTCTMHPYQRVVYTDFTPHS